MKSMWEVAIEILFVFKFQILMQVFLKDCIFKANKLDREVDIFWRFLDYFLKLLQFIKNNFI